MCVGCVWCVGGYGGVHVGVGVMECACVWGGVCVQYVYMCGVHVVCMCGVCGVCMCVCVCQCVCVVCACGVYVYISVYNCTSSVFVYLHNTYYLMVNL